MTHHVPKIELPDDPTGCFWYIIAFLGFSAVVVTLFNWLTFPG